MDIRGDETYWGHQGWGESNIRTTVKITNKPAVSKGGNILLVTDVDLVLTISFVNWHKVHTNPTNSNPQGTN